MPHNKMEVHQRNAEPWRVTLVDTGDNSMTGGRLKRVFDYVNEEFYLWRLALNTAVYLGG